MIINAQIIPIKKLSYPSATNTEWTFLKNKYANDSIICLGEESHWIETYLEVKNGMVKTLVQENDFNILIMETGFVNGFINTVAYKELPLEEVVYDIWNTKAVDELITPNYLTSQDKEPLMLLGCDIKGPSSYGFANFVAGCFKEIDSVFCSDILRLEEDFVTIREMWEPEIGEAHRGVFLPEEVYLKYKNGYKEILKRLEQYKSQIIEEQPISPIEFEYLKRCILNRIYVLEIMQIPTYQQKHKYRDEKMGENLNWLIHEFVPNQKYIIWGADMHLSKDAKWEANGKEWAANKSMIEVLAELQDKKITSIGIKPMKSLPQSIRKKLKQTTADYYFIDLNDNEYQELAYLKAEHDAIVVCKKTKGIKKYRLD